MTAMPRLSAVSGLGVIEKSYFPREALPLLRALPGPLEFLIRVSSKNYRSFYGDFSWPTRGLVTAPDWDDSPESPRGLHAFTADQYMGPRPEFPFEVNPRRIFQIIIAGDFVFRTNEVGVKFRKAHVVKTLKSEYEAVMTLLDANVFLTVAGKSHTAFRSVSNL